MHLRQRKRGSAVVEFAIAGIAGITLIISTIQLGIVMWNYHTLAYAVHETNRYIASHGSGCTAGGNACAIAVSDIAAMLKARATGIPDTQVNVTLTSQSGTVKSCAPLSACATDSTQWPPASHFDNAAGSYTKLTASISLKPAIVSLWYGSSGSRISSVTLPATSDIPIVF